MHIVIVPDDKVVSVDRKSFKSEDYPFDEAVHAIHWYGDNGEVELKDRDAENLSISTEEEYEKWVKPCYEVWERLNREYEEQKAEELKAYNAPEAVAARALAAKKVERAEKMEAITVTVGDLVFNGDEESQSRMVRTIHASEYNGKTEFEWVMADDSVRTVTLDQLKEAFGKAVLYQNGMWPYIHA